MIDKTLVYNQLIDYMKQYVENQKKITEDARDSASQLPGRNESRYDSLRTENSWVVAGMSKRANELEMQLSIAKKFRLNPNLSEIAEGSYIKLAIEGNSRDYFILPFFGGMEIEGNPKFMVLSTNAPIFDELFGRKKGESFLFRGKNYEILDIV